MTDLEIKEFYRQMMVNIVFRHLEKKYFLYCLAGRDAVLHLSVEEFRNSSLVQVEFNVVFLSCEPDIAGNYIRLEGYAVVSSSGKIYDESVKKENLVDIREVSNNE